jgi:competence protein ComEA
MNPGVGGKRPSRGLPLIAALAIVLCTGITLSAAAASSDTASPVDINAADVEELASLPGVGPALAARIVEFRDKNGPFESVDDLLKVRGIGEKSLEKFRSLVKVAGKKR